MKMFQTKRFILDSLRNRPKRGVRMTIKEASERYNIPMEILREYESWGLCGAVKKVMGSRQYDDTDLERLSLIMTLHDVGFATPEVKHWHGAKADSWFSHIAVEVPGEETSNAWLEPVDDEAYSKLQ